MFQRYLIGAGLAAVGLVAFWLYSAGGDAATDARALKDARDHIQTYERIEDAISDDRGADWRDRLHEARTGK